MSTPKRRAKPPNPGVDPDSPEQFLKCRWYARRSSPRAIRKLINVMTTSGSPSEQLRASQILLQFAWGQPISDVAQVIASKSETRDYVELPKAAQIKHLENALAALRQSSGQVQQGQAADNLPKPDGDTH